MTETKPRVCGFCDALVKRGDKDVGLVLVICDRCRRDERRKASEASGSF